MWPQMLKLQDSVNQLQIGGTLYGKQLRHAKSLVKCVELFSIDIEHYWREKNTLMAVQYVFK